MIYVVNKLVLKQLTTNWIIHGYLNDIFAMPCILAYSNLLIVAARRHDLLLNSAARVGALTLFCSLTWEFGAALCKPTSVYDPLDFIAYAVGAVAYYGVTAATCCRGLMNNTTVIVENP